MYRDPTDSEEETELPPYLPPKTLRTPIKPREYQTIPKTDPVITKRVTKPPLRLVYNTLGEPSDSQKYDPQIVKPKVNIKESILNIDEDLTNILEQNLKQAEIETTLKEKEIKLTKTECLKPVVKPLCHPNIDQPNYSQVIMASGLGLGFLSPEKESELRLTQVNNFYGSKQDYKELLERGLVEGDYINVKQFLQQIQNIVHTYDSRLGLVKLKSKDRAHYTVNFCVPGLDEGADEKEKWELFKKRLIAAYTEPEGEENTLIEANSLTTSKRRKGESFYDLYLRMQKQSHEIRIKDPSIDTEKLIKGVLLREAPVKLRERLAKISDLSLLASTLQKQIELNPSYGISRRATHNDEGEGTHKVNTIQKDILEIELGLPKEYTIVKRNEMETLKDKVKNLESTHSQNLTSDKRQYDSIYANKRCHVCNKQGHLMKSCWYNPKSPNYNPQLRNYNSQPFNYNRNYNLQPSNYNSQPRHYNSQSLNSNSQPTNYRRMNKQVNNAYNKGNINNSRSRNPNNQTPPFFYKNPNYQRNP